MEWIAAAIVFLGLLYFFPRVVGLTLGLAVVVALGTAAFFWWQSYAEDAAAAKVVPAFEVDAGATHCKPEYPVFLGFMNDSSRKVKSIDFGVEIRRKGYSGVIGRFSNLKQDKILAPGEGFGLCYAMPALSVNAALDDLELEPSYKLVIWD